MFQPDVCTGCHDVLKSPKLSNNATLNIHHVDYLCIINRIAKSEAMGLLQNSNLNVKSGILNTEKFIMYKMWVNKS